MQVKRLAIRRCVQGDFPQGWVFPQKIRQGILKKGGSNALAVIRFFGKEKVDMCFIRAHTEDADDFPLVKRRIYGANSLPGF